MPLSKIVKPRKSPVLLRRRMPSTSEVSDAFVETESADRQVFIRQLPDWMQPPRPDAIRSRPAQSPPEIVLLLFQFQLLLRRTLLSMRNCVI